MTFCWKGERSSVKICLWKSSLIESEFKVLMCSCIPLWTLLTHMAWLAMTVASLRKFFHFLTGEIPVSFEDPVEELLSRETSLDHLLTEFPGETEGSEDR